MLVSDFQIAHDPSSPSGDDGTDPLYSSEIRLWKLTGLICAYVVAVGVNVGLTVALFATKDNKYDHFTCNTTVTVLIFIMISNKFVI